MEVVYIALVQTKQDRLDDSWTLDVDLMGDINVFYSRMIEPKSIVRYNEVLRVLINELLKPLVFSFNLLRNLWTLLNHAPCHRTV